MVTADSQKLQVPRWPSLTAVVEFATGSHARAIAALLAIAFLCFLPGLFSIPPIDRDEARFAQATKQMAETGDYVDIRFQDEVRYKKPVGIYWLQAAVVKAASALSVPNALSTIWLYRIPSLLGALGAVLLTYWAGLAFVSRRAALLAALMMASCVLLGIERLLAKTDAALLMTVVAAMGVLGRAYLAAPASLRLREDARTIDIDERQGDGRGNPPLLGEGGATDSLRSPPTFAMAAVFWTALAAGVLLKGPVIIMVVGLTAATLSVIDRSTLWLRALRPLPGILWFALLVLPWFIAIIGRSGDQFFADSMAEDLAAKIFSGQETHGAPPGYYLVLFFVTFWPGATLAALAAPAVWTARKERTTRFLLGWLAPSWLVLELVVTKLPHYVLPLYPAVAVLIAGVIERRALSRAPALVWGTIWWFVVTLAAGLIGIVALLVIGRQFGPLAWCLIGAASIMALFAWRLYEIDGAEHSLLRAISAAILLAVALFSLILPALGPLFPSAQLARLLRDSGCPRPQAAAVGYQEPSLVFLAGTHTRLADAAGAAEFLDGGGCRFAFVDSHFEKSFGQRAEVIGLRYAAGPRIEGINISTGRWITIAVYRSAGVP